MSSKFAGFDFPKYVWTLPEGSKEMRQAAIKRGYNKYMVSPDINPTGTTFHMSEQSMPDLPWRYADEILGVRKRAYKADYWSGLEFRGIVMTLPHRRGFIAGWTDTEYCRVDYDIFDNEHDAAVTADDMALSACEWEIEFQEGHQDETEEM
jgi:hypothetical protein